MNKEKRDELKEAVKILSDFVEHVPGGESYWIDEEGKSHTADMGYVCEFLTDLEGYLNGNPDFKGSEKPEFYPARYRAQLFFKDGYFEIAYCQKYEKTKTHLVIYINEYNKIGISIENLSFADFIDTETSSLERYLFEKS